MKGLIVDFTTNSELVSNLIIILLLVTPIFALFYSNIYLLAFLYGISFLLFVQYSKIHIKTFIINKIVVLYSLLLLALLLPLTIYKIESFWGNYISFLFSVLIYFIFINLKGNVELTILRFVKISTFIICTQILFIAFTNISNNIQPGLYKANIQMASGNSNSLGFFLLILFFILYETIKKKSFIDYLLLLLLISSIVTLQSRSTILAFLIVLILHTLEKDFKKLVTVLVLFFLALFSFQSVYAESKGKIVEGYYSKSEIVSDVNPSEFAEYPILERLDNISSKRLTLYKKVFNEYKKSPVIGLGLGNVNITFQGNYGPVRPHNIFLDLLTSSGIIGLILFSGILVILIRFFWEHKNKSSYIRGVFYGLVAILFQGMLEPNIFTFNIDIFLWTVIGVSYLIVNQIKESQNGIEVL